MRKKIRKLIRRLSSIFPKRRKSAERQLMELDEDTVAAQLARAINFDTEPMDRAWIAQMLSQMKNRKAADVLIDFHLEEYDSYVSFITLEAIRDFPDQEYVAKTLDERIDKPGSDFFKIFALFATLSTEVVFEVLKNRLVNDKRPAIRRESIRLLSRMESRTAADIVINSLNTDKNKDVRCAASVAVRKMLGKQSLPFLLEALHVESSDTVRVALLEALVYYPDSQVIGPLSRLLENKFLGFKVRKLIIKILTYTKDKTIIPILYRIISGNDHVDLRAIAIFALGKMFDASTIPFLLNLIRTEPQFLLRFEAVQILRKLDAIPGDRIDKIYFHIAAEEWTEILRFGFNAVSYLKQILAITDQAERDFPRIKKSIDFSIAEILRSVIRVRFGGKTGKLNPAEAHNPDVKDLNLPMVNLNKAILYADDCDPKLVERFITYAVNLIGEKIIKKKIKISIIGDPYKLGGNLFNMLQTLFMEVRVVPV
ncbi:MAG: HEAT repeat domain-containing protein [Spirochaetales bacterium]|nr:HEAT repeat domain-containing protein [Spirochaetales bacterium]